MITSRGPDPEKIHSLFSSIAKGYDNANNVMTLGLVHHWRRRLAGWSGARKGSRILDCATGTGDLAIEFAKIVGEAGAVIGTDFCAAMLESAPIKARALGLRVQFQLADAMALPFPEHSFDIVSIAYGIRNVAEPIKALKEMARVCKPGGHVMILETGESHRPLMGLATRLGGLVTGEKKAYKYLCESSGHFPSGERFLQLMRSAGCFKSCESKSLMFGASYIYKGAL